LSRPDKKNQYPDLSSFPLPLVIKAQALIRGMLARKRVKAIYGFQVSPGIIRKPGSGLLEMDPVKLEEQRQRVQEIRKLLSPFEYGADEDDATKKEHRAITVLPDNA
jgi:hypothetical protein